MKRKGWAGLLFGGWFGRAFRFSRGPAYTTFAPSHVAGYR